MRLRTGLRWSKSRPGLFEVFDRLYFTICRASISEHLTHQESQKQRTWANSSSFTHSTTTDYWPKGFWSFEVLYNNGLDWDETHDLQNLR